MLIVSRQMLDQWVSDNSYSLTWPDWHTYTFWNSSRNIFTGQVTSMFALFNGKTNFNEDIWYWDVSNVDNMVLVFANATNFNQPIWNWNTKNLEKTQSMFMKTESFNQPMWNWDVSSADNMIHMFWDASSFDQDISQWCAPLISSKPDLFDDWTSSNFQNNTSMQPQWGTCGG